MSDKDILEKAIQKAIDGGFSYRGYTQFKVYVPDLNWIEFHDLPKGTHASLEPYSLIFNHDFARALWGEGWNPTSDRPNWIYHLERMVIADDRIKYLGEHLGNV